MPRRRRRAGWAVASFAPWFAVLTYLPLVFKLGGIEDGGRIPIPYTELAISLVGLAVALAVIAIFALHAARNARLASARRAGWIAAFVLLNGLALPVYWWRYIRE